MKVIKVEKFEPRSEATGVGTVKGIRYFVEGETINVPSFIEWWEHYGRPEDVEIVRGDAYLVRGNVKPTPRAIRHRARRWVVRLICCGMDDGRRDFDSWNEADQFRRA